MMCQVHQAADMGTKSARVVKPRFSLLQFLPKRVLYFVLHTPSRPMNGRRSGCPFRSKRLDQYYTVSERTWENGACLVSDTAS